MFTRRQESRRNDRHLALVEEDYGSRLALQWLATLVLYLRRQVDIRN